ncbi:hypothetical protein V1515DRAFT_621714 [Lipomyces mesembrius]
MSDTDCEVSSVSWTDELSVSLSKRARRSQRIDYHLLNDGSDEEAASEDRTVKKTRLNLPLEDNTPTDSPVADGRDAGSPQEQALSVAELPDTSGLRIDRQLLKSRVTVPCSGRTSTSPRFITTNPNCLGKV